SDAHRPFLPIPSGKANEMLERFFRLREHGTNVRTELLAGLTTFLTMAYIIFLQPGILSGEGLTPSISTGLDFHSVMIATCLSAALATAVMGLYARYPIGQAPGMGENFFFVFSVLPAAAAMIAVGAEDGSIDPATTSPWQIALGVVFIAGLLFMLLTLFGIRRMVFEAISPSMRHAIAIGIGLFIALIGMRNAGLVVPDAAPPRIDPHFASPDLIVFFFGLFLTAVLFARRVRGAIVWGILGATLFAVLLQFALVHAPEAMSQSEIVTKSRLMRDFAPTYRVVSAPPSMAPTLLKMDLVHALSWPMMPFILVFLFMDVFDTLGTLIGVSEQAGLIKNGKLPRMRQAMMSDAVGTVAGAAMGTSTVTSFIESAAGVEQGGRTGLTAVVVAVLFLAALFFSPLIGMVGHYSPITAPALIVVGAMMLRNTTHIEWNNYAESLPSFLIIVGIPFTYSIADGLALGLIAYPVVKLAAGQHRDVRGLMVLLALVMVAYFVFVRSRTG
ncbi:MAG: NCS2 family permease, partial [Pirellulales bacterium]|nr:NCS2 family permease [Pirellulales bacterium]